MPLPHTPCITKTNATPFLLLFSLFFSATFLYLLSSLFLKFQHFSVKKFSTPLNYYFIKGERVRKIKMKNREISANPEKMKNNKDRERVGCRSLTEDWIRAKQMKGRYCIREDFSIFRCFFVLHLEES